MSFRAVLSRMFPRHTLRSAAFTLACTFLSIGPAAGESFDWRNVGGLNWNSTVKSQWGGTCWDFGPTACHEAKYMITRNDTSFVPDYSEQQNCWENNPDMGSTQGGGGFSLIGNYYLNHGVVSETECPVNLNDSSTWDTPPGGYPFLATGWESRVWKSSSAQYNIATSNDVATNTAILKNAIKTTGPVYLDINPGELFNTPGDIKKSNYVYSPGGGHAVSLEGFVDDPSYPTGGYWIIKNSWGTGTGQAGYNFMPYGSSVEYNHCQNTIGSVYYTGPMYHTGPWDATGHDYTGTAATNTWKGTTSAVWNTNSATAANWSNNSTGQSFTWLNQELQAVFDAYGANKAITVSGKVIAHGLTVSAAGYSFAPADGSSSLTITAGGITTTENLAISAPVFIGGPQTWTVPSGKTITVSGALHTIVSNLTFAGAGSTTISGTIDGGGAINIYGGAKAGSLIQSGTGTLTLSGVTSFDGDVTVQSGSGTLYITPPSGAATFTGAWLGSGSISFGGTALTLGGASNFSGSLAFTQPCSLTFTPAAGVVGTYSCRLSNNGSVTQNGPGTTIFPNRASNTNNYTGGTTITAGILQANSGNGLPSTSFLTLDGGILQSYGTSAITFNRPLGTSGSAVAWTPGGGGFSAGNGSLTVNIPGGALTWSSNASDQGSKILGTLKLSSASATAVTTLQNGINLGGADRTIQVDDNPNSSSDNAVISGNITGTGGVVKTGDGLLILSGTNNYSAATTISGGVLQANLGTALPTGSYVILDGGVLQNNSTSFARSLGTTQDGSHFQWTVGGGGFSPSGSALTVNIGGDGHTLAWGPTPGTNIMGTLKLGSSSATADVTFQNALDLGGDTRTIQTDGNFSAYLPSAITGTGALVKTGSGTLRFTGAGNTYTGSTSIQGGTVYLNKSSGYAIPGDLTIANGSTFVILQSANQIPTTANISFTGWGNPHFEVYGHGVTVASISGGAGVIENTEGQGGVISGSLTVNNATDCYYGGYIRNNAGGSGTLSLTKLGAGTLTLVGGGVQYTGGTTVSEGKLVLQNIWDPTFLTRGITVGSGATLSIGTNLIQYDNFTGGISNSGAVVLTSGKISGPITGNGTLNIATTGPLMLSGSTSNSYSGAMSISGNSSVTLAKTAGYAITGDFTIANGSNGVAVQGTNPQFPATAKVTFSGNGEPRLQATGNTVTVGGIIATEGTLGAIIENLGGTSGPADATFIVNNDTDCTYNGEIRDNVDGNGKLALVKGGSGALTLTGGYYSGQYTGGLTVNAGTLNYAAGRLPTGSYTINGGTLNVGGLSQTIGTLKLAGGTISGTGTLTSNAAYDVQAGTTAANLAGAGIALNKTTGGTAILSGTNSYSGTTTVSAGTLQLGAGGTTGSLTNSSIVINAGATLDVNRSGYITLSNAISGAGTFVKDGLASLTLSACTSSGDLVVNAGSLAYSGTSTLPLGNYTINGGSLSLGSRTPSIGTLRVTAGTISGGTLTSNADYDVRGGTIATVLAGGATIDLNKTGPDTAIIAGNCSFSGLTTVSAGTLQLGGGSAIGTVAGNISIDAAGTLNYYHSNNATFAGKLSGTGTFMKTGVGTVTMTGANSFSGNVIVGGGTLDYSANSALPAGKFTVTAGTLKIGALSQSITGLQITGGTLAGAGTLNSATTFDVQGGVIDAVLAGTAGLTKTGSGAALLENDNPYTGSTLITDGVLALSEFGQLAHTSTIDNRAALLISAGDHTVNNIVGTGATLVDLSSTLTATSIVQDSLVIGGDHSDLLATASAGAAWAPTPVPEPSTWVLLVSLVVVSAAIRARQVKK